MEQNILKTTIDKLLSRCLKIVNLEDINLANSKKLYITLSENVIDKDNTTNKVLEFENLLAIYDSNSQCSKVGNEILALKNDFTNISLELVNHFSNIISSIDESGCGFTLNYIFEDKKYCVKIIRKFSLNNEEAHLNHNLVNIIILSDSKLLITENISFERINPYCFVNKATITNILKHNIYSTIDVMFENASKCVVENQTCSASFLQRKLNIDYTSASILIDQLETHGIISSFDGNARKVLIKDLNSLATKFSEIN